MERLTKYDENAKCYLPFSLTDWSEIKIMNKLGELEDVLEKFEIENPDMLALNLQTIENINIQNVNLRNELAELKQKAIVPKFMVGQEVYIINKEYYYKKHWCVEKHKIVGIEDKIDRKEKYVRWYILTYGDIKLGNRYKFQEKDVFATKEEAEQKLAEIGGKDE